MTKSEARSNGGEWTFDSMAWLERVQAEIYEEIKDLTPAQELEYWRQAALRGPRRKEWREIYRRKGIVVGTAVRSSRPV
jgi:hypothetical protein